MWKAPSSTKYAISSVELSKKQPVSLNSFSSKRSSGGVDTDAGCEKREQAIVPDNIDRIAKERYFFFSFHTSKILNIYFYIQLFVLRRTANDVERTPFRFIIKATDIFSQNTQRDELNATQKENRNERGGLPFKKM